MKPLNPRKTALLLALVATVLAVVFAPSQPPEEAPARRPKADRAVQSATRASSGAASADQDELPLALVAQRIENPEVEMFRVSKAVSAPQAAASAPAPSQPVVPPLPFRYLGRMVDGSQVAVLISYQSKDFVVHAGETVAEYWRVERIDADNMLFVYLPLNERQTLKIGEPN